LFFICYKHSSLTAKIRKQTKTKFGRIDSCPKFPQKYCSLYKCSKVFIETNHRTLPRLNLKTGDTVYTQGKLLKVNNNMKNVLVNGDHVIIENAWVNGKCKPVLSLLSLLICSNRKTLANVCHTRRACFWLVCTTFALLKKSSLVKENHFCTHEGFGQSRQYVVTKTSVTYFDNNNWKVRYNLFLFCQL